LKAVGVERHMLPDNINDYFGVFGSDRQNVIKACDIVRQSPLIGPKIPVHGLLVDIQSGKLEWLVNGYQAWATMRDRVHDAAQSAAQSAGKGTLDALKSIGDFKLGGVNLSETKIGETVTKAEDWLAKKIEQLGGKSADLAAPPEPTEIPAPPPMTAPPGQQPPKPKMPIPPSIRPRMHMRPRGK
jgi:carbonic anhydrase